MKKTNIGRVVYVCFCFVVLVNGIAANTTSIRWERRIENMEKKKEKKRMNELEEKYNHDNQKKIEYKIHWMGIR